jgi:hypothetical protein
MTIITEQERAQCPDSVILWMLGAEIEIKRLRALIRSAHGPDGCACIKDLPGDNYTCEAHRALARIAQEEAL